MIFNSKIEECVTCAFWDGKRSISNTRTYVDLENISIRGKCIGGGHDKQMVGARTGCKQWVKWAPLK